MEKYVDCHNCQNQYDCERTYLGGCTDGKEWEQEEKKLIDEEIAKEKSKERAIRDEYCIRIQRAFENMRCGCDCEDIPSILVDFEKVIKSEQKAEIERLTEDWKQRINKARQRQFNSSKKEELASAYEKLIESLEDELEHRQNDYIELQKQVDELKEKIMNLKLAMTDRVVRKSYDSLLTMPEDVEEIFGDAYESEFNKFLGQAVKETAKEIFTKVDNAFSLYYPHGQIPYSVFQERLKKLAKEKGVEVK